MKPTEIPPARPSSTVVLVRDCGDGPEVFLVKRRKAASFGGAYVFPGGVIDPPDELIIEDRVDISSERANKTLQLCDGGACYYSAAIRELFEETGVLLAEHAINTGELEQLRADLNAGVIHWHELVTRKELTLKFSALRYFSHWITPDTLPKRYTTRFFLAEMPQDQTACFDNAELTGELWISPTGALEAAAEGKLPLHYPTIKTIGQLAEFDTTADMFKWAADCEQKGVTAIHPVIPAGMQGGEPGIRRSTSDL